MLFVGIEREELSAFTNCSIRQPVGRSSHDFIHQRLCIGGWGGGVASGFQQVQHEHRCGRCIEADAIGQPSVLVGVVGEHQSNLAVRFWRGAQLRPTRDQVRDPCDPVAVGLIGGDGAFGGFIKICLALKADRARQDAAVDLGEGDVHGDVAGRQARQAFVPGITR